MSHPTSPRLTPNQALARVLPGPLALDPLRDHALIEEGRAARAAWVEATRGLIAFYEKAHGALADGTGGQTEPVAEPAADRALVTEADPEVPPVAPAEVADFDDLLPEHKPGEVPGSRAPSDADFFDPRFIGEAADTRTSVAATPVATTPVVSSVAASGTSPAPALKTAAATAHHITSTGRQPLGSGNLVQVPISDLVLNGFLSVGEVLVPTDPDHQGPSARAVVTADGLRIGHHTYTKLSPAAAAVTGKSTSGWGFWQRAETGERLDQVRETYRDTFPQLRPPAKAG